MHRFILWSYIGYIVVINSLVFCEWVEIPQITESSKKITSVKSNIPILKQSDLFSRILDKNSSAKAVQFRDTEISKEWLDYQRERFDSREFSFRISALNKTRTPPLQKPKIENYWDTLPTTIEVKIPIAVTAGDEKDLVTIYESPKSATKQHHESSNSTRISAKNDKALKGSNRSSLSTQSKIIVNRKSKVKKVEKKKMTSFQGFMEFLKDIQNSFITKTSRGIKDKIKTLTKFRDLLLINIEDRIKGLWPQKETKPSRQKRGILGDNIIDLPSAEAALMTINFLTFAVFLIKLVLQVINTIKSKHYNYNGIGVSTMEAIQVVRRKRNATYLDDIDGDRSEYFNQIVENINSYNGK